MKERIKKDCKSLFLLLVLGILSLTTVYAQGGSQITVNGTVSDSQGETIIGASVVVKGTGTGTVTDIDGNYTLNNAPSNGTLVITFLGYKAKEIKIAGQTKINTTLEEDAVMLGDVVAIGYAVGSQKTISGAVKRLGKEDMNVGVVANPLEAMRGKIAGVNIQKVGGDPTTAPSVRIRGTTSLTGGNDPLVVIDGVFGDLNLLNALAPSDIESFTILKDASEAAQYGSRGASGVIVVTTQKGKFGTKTLNYEGTFGVESIYKNIKMLDANQYRQTVKDYGILNAIDGGASSDFMEAMQQTGYTQSHKVSFGGGTEDANYRASLGVIDQKGIIKNNYMKNYTAKIDLSQYFFDRKIQIEMGMFGSKRDQRYVNDHKKTFYSATSFNPTLPLAQNADGTWPEDINAVEADNPLGRLSINDNENNAYLNTHAKLTWTILEGLKLSAMGSYTYNSKENSKYVPINIKEGIRNRGLAHRGLNREDILMGNILLNYKKTVDKHAFDFLGLIEGQSYKYHGFSSDVTGFATNYFGTDKLQAGAVSNWDQWKSHRNGYDIYSYMGRFNYIYDKKYIATVNFRSDGSSKLGANNKWGFFPSASLAWDMGEEEFIKNISQINKFKVRAGYGVTGNQDAIKPFNSQRLLEPSGVTTVDGLPWVSLTYKRNDNPDLRWETKKTFNAGFDASLFNEKIDVTFDYYNSNTVDLLYDYFVPVPPFTHKQLLANMGKMNNKGLELAVTVKPIMTKDMDLAISVNGSYQENTLVSLSGSYNGFALDKDLEQVASISGAGSIGGNNNVTYIMKGQPLGVFYLPKATGLINDGFGNYTYNIVDLNNNGILELDDKEDSDRYVAGQAMPKFYLGGNINFRYKQLDFQTQLNGAFGHKIFNGTSLTYHNMNTFPTYNVLEGAPEKQIRDSRVSDYWLEKGDYLNIAYMTVGYNFKTATWGKWIKGLKLSASVNNIYTFTNYSGLSPMINSTAFVNKDNPLESDNNKQLGLDDKRFYPLSRTYSITVNVNF
ncbi:MAG: hypothetical protein RL662_507 [Bacteroidota bacterium]|jgi:TonB-linked SusC/RagA family outer membrane protein